MKPPESRTAITTRMTAVEGPDRPKPDVFGAAVKVSHVHGDLRLWLREAFNLLELCRTEPEKGLRYLALWFVRLGRAMA